MPYGGSSQTLAYDHDNRVTSVTNTNGVETYGYDGGNRRVFRTRGTTTDIFFYGVMGERLGRYRAKAMQDPNGNPITGPQCEEMFFYFAGRLIKTEAKAFQPNFVEWTQQDRLGSAVTHLPYGDERTATANDRLKFATYWRESSGVDYAQQRYYSSTYGRFLTSDPYRASGGPSDPSSWNRYAYVQGDPVNNTDRTGMYVDNCLELICMISPLLGSDPVIGGGGGCFDPNGFLASTNPACYFLLTIVGAAPSPPTAEPTALDCDGTLYSRGVPTGGRTGAGTHQYLQIHDRNGGLWTIEGGPEHFGDPRNFGKLQEYIDRKGNGLKENNPAKDSIWGGRLLMDCDLVDKVINTAKGFKRTADYELLGPNSNSFMSWLLKKTNLSLMWPLPPPGAIGWGMSIPGNP